MIPKGWNISAGLLAHSLQNNPSDLEFDGDSDIAKAIKSSKVFQDIIDKLVKKYRNINYWKDSTEYLQFKTGDLFGALHKCELHVTGIRYKHLMKLSIKIVDEYDFAFEVKIYKNNFSATLGNNLAWMDQFFGIVQNYEIRINFSKSYNLFSNSNW